MKNTKTPWWLVIKYVSLRAYWSNGSRTYSPHRFYWFRLTIVSLIWFIYDFLTYSFGIYSSAQLDIILGSDAPIWKSFGWNTISKPPPPPQNKH